MVEVVLPQLGEGIEKAVVSFWHVEQGQKVSEGQDLVEMATDKAVFNVPSPAGGILKEIISSEGQDVKIGEVLAIIE